MRIWIWSLAFATAAAACTSDPDRETPRPEQASSAEAEPAGDAAPKRPPRKFDVEGRLIPSDEYIAGIRLPRGAELFRADEVNHVYRIRAPIDKVLAYIGPMMITGNVERRGKGAIYKRASVRGAEVNPTKVDVSITEIGSNLVRIAVTELPPPPVHIPSTDQTKAAARDTWRTLD
jgi:hypothetical protein